MPDIAGNKYSRHARFEIKRFAASGPARRQLAFAHEMLTGQDVAFENRLSTMPSSQSVRGIRTGVNQQRAGGNFFPGAGLVVLDGQGFRNVQPLRLQSHLSSSLTEIFFVASNLVFQILRHGGRKGVAANCTIVTRRANFGKIHRRHARRNSPRRRCRCHHPDEKTPPATWEH